MPLVFVHGVNVREGTTDDAKKALVDQVDARDQLFRTIGLGGLVQPPARLHIENPYWGGYGVTLSSNLASLPDPGTEKFGPAVDDVMTQVLTETAASSGGCSDGDHARRRGDRATHTRSPGPADDTAACR